MSRSVLTTLNDSQVVTSHKCERRKTTGTNACTHCLVAANDEVVARSAGRIALCKALLALLEATVVYCIL